LYEKVRSFSQEMEEKVRERTQELRAFVSAVYHELNNPLTAIQGYTDLLLNDRAGPLNDKQAQFLEIIRRNGGRLMGLVADLSDIARIDDGRLAIHPEPLGLNNAVQDTVNALFAIIRENELEVAIQLDRRASIVMGDPQRVVQILTNLVGNACRYTPPGGQIKIASRRINGSVEITVQDTGIGIPEQEQDRVFDRFFRGSAPLVRSQGGTGLGLAIAKSLVELHGGELWLKSKVGQGATFGFTLPLPGEPGEQEQYAALMADPGYQLETAEHDRAFKGPGNPQSLAKGA
jgi:signal transduction histidine kinase